MEKDFRGMSVQRKTRDMNRYKEDAVIEAVILTKPQLK